MGAVASQAIMESLRMKLYDKLSTPRTLSEVCTSTQTTGPAVAALLDLLVAKGLLVRSDEKYANSPVAAEFLVSWSPFYQGDLLELHQGINAQVIADMSDRLRGRQTKGGGSGEIWSRPNALAWAAQYAMRGPLQDTVAFVTALPGFDRMRTMCDVAGNHGRYTMALLDRNPELQATICDLPRVTPLIESACRKTDYEGRISVTALDLRSDDLPRQAYDLVLVSHVLHMFSDNLLNVVRKIAAAVKPGGWLVSQNMNGETHVRQARGSARQLVTCLMGHATHFLEPGALEAALTACGLTDLRTAKTGPADTNVVCAARKMETHTSDPR